MDSGSDDSNLLLPYNYDSHKAILYSIFLTSFSVQTWPSPSPPLPFTYLYAPALSELLPPVEYCLWKHAFFDRIWGKATIENKYIGMHYSRCIVYYTQCISRISIHNAIFSSSVADLHHFNMRITVRIRLFTIKQIRIRPFTLMRVRMQICSSSK